MVSARLVDCPDEPEESELQPNPDMMFALGEEPVGVRILTYQSSSALKRIINALDEEEVAILKQSSFGKLLEIAEKPAFSGRFARYMLSRQLKTKKKHEAWFRFAGKPVRFSLREFAIVTGLPCGKYPKKSKMKLKETISEQPYWPSLFGKVDSVSVSAVIKMLYRKTVKDRDIRIKYACLALLESVLLPTSLNMKISRDHAEAIKDLDAFFSYPWGRVAFDMLMDSIKERDELALSRDTIAVKGFVLALQLVMIEAVPALTEAGQDSCSTSESDSVDIDLTAQDIFTKKTRLNPSHARTLDKKTDERVSIVLVEDPSRPLDNADLEYFDEEHDSRVESMVARSRFDYHFNNSSFGGGLTMIDLDNMRNCEGSSRKAKKGKKVAKNQKDVQPPNITKFFIEKLKLQLEQLEKNMHVASSRVAAVEGNVRKQVEGLIGKFKEEMVTTVKELVSAKCREHLRVPNVASKTQAPTASASQQQAYADANAMFLRDALDNISSYSTPPPATQMNENVNPTPTTKHPADSGYISVTPVSHGPAQSANSENRVRLKREIVPTE